MDFEKESTAFFYLRKNNPEKDVGLRSLERVENLLLI